MFWFDKHDQRALFCDIRNETLVHVRTDCGNKEIDIRPDVVSDFTDLPFPDDTFYQVVFDPPHVQASLGNITKYFGSLPKGDWKPLIKAGFTECFRVLRPCGTLIFKWSETQIPLREVLALTPEKPLFGHRVGKRAGTHWISFLKSGNQVEFLDGWIEGSNYQLAIHGLSPK